MEPDKPHLLSINCSLRSHQRNSSHNSTMTMCNNHRPRFSITMNTTQKATAKAQIVQEQIVLDKGVNSLVIGLKRIPEELAVWDLYWFRMLEFLKDAFFNNWICEKVWSGRHIDDRKFDNFYLIYQGNWIFDYFEF